jgi:hypothetical protein
LSIELFDDEDNMRLVGLYVSDQIGPTGAIPVVVEMVVENLRKAIALSYNNACGDAEVFLREICENIEELSMDDFNKE